MRPIVLAGSAGAVDALRAVLAGLPSGLAAPVLVAVHMSPASPSALPRILARAGRLPAAAAVDGEALEDARVYVAVPDHHLVIGPTHVHLRRAALSRTLAERAAAAGRSLSAERFRDDAENYQRSLLTLRRLLDSATGQNRRE